MAEEALDPAAYIFEGLWTDWTRGRVLGLTWTLCPSKATLLTNSLALFVTLAGGQLWTIIRFAIHQIRASHRPKQYSERFMQQQVILRNASTDLHTMRLMAQIGWAARQSAGKQYLFPLSIFLLAIAHYIIFVAAGTLSNNIINTGSEGTFSNKRLNLSSTILSRSPHCGVWSPDYVQFTDGGIKTDSLDSVRISKQYIINQDRNVQLSLEYAQDCYTSSPNYYMSSKCDTMRKRRMEYTERDYAGPCPFGEGFCHDDHATIVFDTQVIDSHEDLGMNARHGDRITYQRRTTCAVLNDTGRIEQESKNTALATAYARYGPSLTQGSDYTYSWSNWSSRYTEFTPQVTIPYHVNTQKAYGPSPTTDDSWNMFEPLPELRQTTADLTLFFLSFTGRYFEPVDDPWFSAHQVHHEDVPVEFARIQYERDNPISTLGCLEQHQFCTRNGSCTPFLGWGQVQSNAQFNSTLNDKQMTAFDRILRAADASSLAQITRILAVTGSPLLAIANAAAQRTVLSLKVPNDQWRRELRYWHSIAMAQLQRTIVQWGTGQIATEPSSQLIRPTKEGDVWFCANLMVPSTVYQSFSVVWLALMLTVGIVIILISWTIEDISDWVHPRSGKLFALRKMWDSYHMLRLTAFMMRNSWGPVPPPKDFPPSTHASYPPGLEIPPTIRVVTSHDRLFPAFHVPHMSRDAMIDDQRPDTASTPRTWSELPHPPRRDSWIELGLNNFDFGLDQHPATASKSPSVNEKPHVVTESLAAPSLRLSSLRAHALARMQRGVR